jgi:hypothetical protein
MAFNITSWGKRGRDFGRGAPPPPGSIEYVAVGDMWDPEVYARQMRADRPAPSSSGLDVKLYEISFGDLDAAENYVASVDRAVKQARRVGGDKILSRDDERSWDGFMSRWRPFAADMRLVPGSPSMMLEQNKRAFDLLVSEARAQHDRLARKGMSEVPVPYAGELLLLLRQMPKKLTAAQMSAKLRAGVKCGDRLLDEHTTWFDWVASRDHLGLRDAVADAGRAADIYGRSRTSSATYSPGDPAYDEFLRRLTKIWIEASGLYGMRQTQSTASAELKDKLRELPQTSALYFAGLVAAAGAAYLGVGWLMRPRQTTAVGIPDAYPER